jgi:hypothetical protein
MQNPEYAPSAKMSNPQTCRDSYQALSNTNTKQRKHLVAGDREKEGERSSRTCSIQQWNFRIGSTATDGDQPVADFCLPVNAFQDLRFRDAFIASDIEQGVCRTLISLFLRSRTNRPLKPGEGRVRELEKEESYSY